MSTMRLIVAFVLAELSVGTSESPMLVMLSLSSV